VATRIGAFDRERLIQSGRARFDAGAGPVTLGIDIGMIGLVLSHAAAVHGLPVSTERVALARTALKRLGLIGKRMERDLRPIDGEIDALDAVFLANERQVIPVGRIIRFAIATAMRLDEICRDERADVSERRRMRSSATVRTRAARRATINGSRFSDPVAMMPGASWPNRQRTLAWHKAG
jgi:hypothetical protein